MEPQPLGAQVVPTLPARSNHFWFWLLCLLLGLGIWTNFWPHCNCYARPQGQLTACKSNCKKVAVALEMYASDNRGLYPPRLEPYLIQGNYLKAIPTCPAAGKMTFGDYRADRLPDRYQFSCHGNNHPTAHFSGSPEDMPAYDSSHGLLQRPSP